MRRGNTGCVEVLDVTTVLLGGELALVERVEGDAGGVVDRVLLIASDFDA